MWRARSENMKVLFRSGHDIHRWVASGVFEKPEEEIDFHTELEEIEFADDIYSLASIADSLDKRGLIGAAKIIDQMIENKVKKMADPNRCAAIGLRKKYQKRTQDEEMDLSLYPLPAVLEKFEAMQKLLSPILSQYQ